VCARIDQQWVGGESGLLIELLSESLRRGTGVVTCCQVP
jgi:hypothetical protein